MTETTQPSFETALDELQKRIPNKVSIWTPDIHGMGDPASLEEALVELGLEVRRLTVRPDDFKDYLRKAKYRSRRKDIYKNTFYEKTLEHFIGFKLLDLTRRDVFIDIAGAYSPVPEIFSDLSGCRSYSQDMAYVEGIHGNKIGSDASDIPLPNSSVNGGMAACSIEHFEGLTDILLMKEMSRVLKPGGKLVVVPLYLDACPYCVTDPCVSTAENVTFDDAIPVYARKDFNNRHGRHYSPETLFKRLIKPNLNSMTFTIYVLDNPNEIDDSIYCKFILQAESK